jgi:hypothetical protein
MNFYANYWGFVDSAYMLGGVQMQSDRLKLLAFWVDAEIFCRAMLVCSSLLD